MTLTKAISAISVKGHYFSSIWRLRVRVITRSSFIRPAAKDRALALTIKTGALMRIPTVRNVENTAQFTGKSLKCLRYDGHATDEVSGVFKLVY